MTADALAAAMDRAMQDEPLRLRLADAAPQVMDRFSPARVFGEWCRVLGVDAGQQTR